MFGLRKEKDLRNEALLNALDKWIAQDLSPGRDEGIQMIALLNTLRVYSKEREQPFLEKKLTELHDKILDSYSAAMTKNAGRYTQT